jgi:hypothetical protein
MKRTSHKKTYLGIAASISILGIIGLTLVVILALCVLVFFVQLLGDVTGSANVQPTGVAFFKSTGGWDYRRIALIEPYQAVSIDGKTWSIYRAEKYGATPTIRVTGGDELSQTLAYVTNLKLDVIDKRFIVAYAPNTWLGEEQVNEVWVVIIPEENIKKGFTHREEFLAYLDDKGIDQPNLTDANELYKELANKSYLEWFPEEYK